LTAANWVPQSFHPNGGNVGDICNTQQAYVAETQTERIANRRPIISL